jgi:hypothetical protein
MSDWAVGDLVVCVDDVPQAGDRVRSGLVRGRTYTVSGLFYEGPGDRCSVGLTLVELMPPPGRFAFCSDRFRKILPDKHEACETEFVTLLNRIKRKVSA